MAAQGVMATALADYGFDEGIDNTFWKLTTLWAIQAFVTYWTTNKRLPDENS
jgi:hypothetical protein